jgi:predicted PurR-regulated permease PerM
MVKHQKTIEQIAGLTLVGAIVLGCGLVLRPFISAILWAAILCFATWPLYELFRRRLRGRRTLAAALTTAVLALVLVIPFVVVALTFTDTVRSGLQWLDERKAAGVPEPPAWLERVPLVGDRITKSWSALITDAESTIEDWKPWLKEGGRWLLNHSLDLAKGFLHLALSVLIAFFFYRDGEGLVARLREGMQRISGDAAQRMVDVVKATVQSVVYGVLGTALAQGIVAGIGFVIAGVPAPIVLALLTFFLSLLPFGPPIIWIGAAIWLFAVGKTGMGIFMVLYGIFVISIVDNIIKPIIISRGSKLSFIVMFIGVLGGVATFGFIGIFLGPTLLAVGFSLAHELLEQRHNISASILARIPEKPRPAPPGTEAAASDLPADTAGSAPAQE